MTAWLRRNRWGLLALVPALALALWSSVADGFPAYWNAEPREPVTSPAGGWVAFAGGRMQLVELVAATDLVDYAGRPAPLPPGTAAWRARIAFDAPRPETIAGCRLTLEDTEGHVFDAGPAELLGARISYASCLPDSSGPNPDGGKAPGAFATVAYFVLPKTARPAAVRVTLATALPRYARLITG